MLSEDTTEAVISWLTRNAHRGIVRRMYRKSILQAHVIGDAVALHQQLFQSMQTGGVRFTEHVETQVSLSDHKFSCTWCSHTFDCAQKLQVHMWLRIKLYQKSVGLSTRTHASLVASVFGRLQECSNT